MLRKKLLYENERWFFDNTFPFRFFFFKHIMDCGYVPLRQILDFSIKRGQSPDLAEGVRQTTRGAAD